MERWLLVTSLNSLYTSNIIIQNALLSLYDKEEVFSEPAERIYGCLLLGNPDSDFEIRISDFAIEREIRFRISPEIQIRISWISSLPFDWEIRKRICKTVLVKSGLFFANYARACKTTVLKDSQFQIPFRISQSNGKKEIQKQISQR